MNDKRNGSHPPAAAMALNDIYFVLFRHKWKIIIMSALGISVAIGIFFYRGTTYLSEANLWIKYVTSNKPQGPNSEGQTINVGNDGDSIMNTEITILRSFDLASQVATNFGPDKILAKSHGGTNVIAAASMVRDNLIVERIPQSPVLRIIFSHPDIALVQPVLTEIINDYQQRRTEMYPQAGSSYDSLMKETGNLYEDLVNTEEELQKAKNRAGVNDLDEERKANSSLILTAHTQIMGLETELAGHQANLDKLLGKSNGVASAVVTNAAATNAASTNVEAEVAQDKIDEYTHTTDRLDELNRGLTELRSSGFSDTSVVVKEKQGLIKDVETKKKKLEQEEPRLAKLKLATPKVAGQAPGLSTADMIEREENDVNFLQIKIKTMKALLAQIHTEVTNLDALAPGIRKLELKRQLQESNYKNTLAMLQQSKMEGDIALSRPNANIQVTQWPSPPSRERSKTPKIMGMVAAAGIFGGLAWAFLLELYLDHSVRRAKEIEGTLGLRLFLSIPDMNRNGHRRKLKAARKQAALLKEPEPETEGEAAPSSINGSNGSNGDGVNGKLEVAPWDKNHSLHMYNEALRDRLIAYFEANNLNHKPKLVGVTGSAKGCGTTTIAAGLAASLSETGDGNVLLIDMNLEQGSAQEFYKGKPGCELDTALASETRDTAMVQDNLYVVSGRTNGDKLSSMLPKRFANLIPKLKASDYDYIIFDMPPIGRTGVTQRLSGFMDMMLLVVEAEKTSRDVVRQAGTLLSESKANVSVVLNKTRSYIPERFHQEF